MTDSGIRSLCNHNNKIIKIPKNIYYLIIMTDDRQQRDDLGNTLKRESREGKEEK